jgi:serine/threonine protein kinase
MSIAAGTKLGRYEIRSKIGEGGMGEVYLAQDIELDRQVALKILPADVATNQDRMRRFVQEAKAAVETLDDAVQISSGRQAALL